MVLGIAVKMLILCFTMYVHMHIIILSWKLKCCPLTLVLIYFHVDCGTKAELCTCMNVVVGWSYPTCELAAGRSTGVVYRSPWTVPFCGSIQAARPAQSVWHSSRSQLAPCPPAVRQGRGCARSRLVPEQSLPANLLVVSLGPFGSTLQPIDLVAILFP